MKKQKRGCLPIIILWAVCTLMLTIGLKILDSSEGNQTSIILIIIISMFGSIMQILPFILIFWVIKKLFGKNSKNLESQLVSIQQESYKNDDFIDILCITHEIGLPIPQGMICLLKLFESKIEIEANNTFFSLNIEKIKDVVIKTDIDIQKSYVSSAGGAVAGGLMFGSVGALIGGRVKQKTDKQINYILIITYEKEENIKYIGFDVTNQYKEAQKFVSHFLEKFPRVVTEIEL